jgi:hypothetical protein
VTRVMTQNPTVTPILRRETPAEPAASPPPMTPEMMMLLKEIGMPSAIAACAMRKPGTRAAIDRRAPSWAYSRDVAWSSRGAPIQAPARIPAAPTASNTMPGSPSSTP